MKGKKITNKIISMLCAIALIISSMTVWEATGTRASGATESGQMVEQIGEKAYRVVGYFPSYRSDVIDKIDYSALTHLNLSFMRYTNGQLKSDFSDSVITRVLSHCRANDVKVLIAIGGGGGFDTSTKPFSTKESRAQLIKTIVDYVNQYNLDGVDVDVESEDSEIIANYENFVDELRAALGNNKLLTMAVSPWFTRQLNSTIYENFDFINLMTYDYQAGNGPVAPMSQIDTHRDFYTSKGVSMDRMNIGVPFYGYGPGGYADAYTYAQIVAADSNNKYTDECMYNGKKVYYNGETTIRAKAELSKQYGGIMIWELGQDSFDNNSLLKAIKEVLQTEEKPTEKPTERPTERPTEKPTEKPTERPTEAPTKPEGAAEVEINGWQISTEVEGYRVVYSVSDAYYEVEEAGLVYGLGVYSADSDMIVGSANNNVYSFKATDKGKTDSTYSNMKNAQSYVMTMRFIDNIQFYNSAIKVRAYAKLKDGKYIYSDVRMASVYEISDYLYKNQKMNTLDRHNYLYDNILSFVNPSYDIVDYDWNNTVIKPGEL